MIHLERVLFPTDGSECAEDARRYAFHLADHVDASVHVIHVEERKVELADVIDVREADILAELHAPYPEEESPMAEPRVQERTVVHPSAAEGILTYTAEHDTNLIVLGTHGRRGIRRFMLGSVAEEVLRRASCPVMTVGRGAKPPEAMEGGHMLVPLGFSEYQDGLLAHAREIARIYGMKVTLLHVVEMWGLPDVYGIGSKVPAPNKIAERTEGVLEKEAGELREQGMEVKVEVRSGHAAKEILDTAADLDVDFLTIATHGRTGMERVLMGSVAENVIRQAPCPVFAVKPVGVSLVQEEDASNDT